MITYSCFVWWILLFGTTIYCTDDCGDENYSTFDDYGDEKFASNDDYGDEKCPSINDCHPFNGLKGSYVNLYPLIAFPLFSCIITFIVEPLHAYHRHVGLSARHAVLPINFTPTPVATMQDLVDRIARTGPTIVAGVMQETSYEVRKGNRLSFWGLAGWEQFQYKTWAMAETPPPYFHPDQETFFAFKTLEEVFSYNKPLVTKTTLEVSPANDETKMKYDKWVSDTTEGIKEAHKANMIKGKTRDFTESLVTDEALRDNHAPNRLVPSIQLPSLVTNHQDHQEMQEASSRFVYGHMMEAKTR